MFIVISSTMETCKFVIILLLYCVTTAYCYPSKPLNERSPPEVTWQAWLLVDDQNQQNKQQTNAEGVLRRRITPKSVFIAPTFSPAMLPACADGYTSDAMGRCVPIIKIDEDVHYKFLVERLKQKFGPLDYDDETEEEVSTQGPLQINIPLENVEDDEEEADVAIVISPTRSLSVNLDKRDSIDSVEDEKKQELFLKNLAGTTTREPDETTTVTEPITVTYSDEGSTVEAATEAITTTEEDITSTESHNTKRSTDYLDKDITSTTEELSSTTTFDPVVLEVSTPTPKPDLHSPVVIKFPEGPTFKSTFVKFPDADIPFQTQIPSSVESNQKTRDVKDQKVVFRDQFQPEEANLDYSNGVRHLPPATTHGNFNRRNRDRPNSMFLLPPRWSQPNFQKPLVLRFSRKHSFLDESQFKHPDYYRAVPMDDFAYLFSKHRPSGHR